MSLEKIKNEFTVEQEDTKFLMKREIIERIDASDFISLHEDLEKQIKDYNDVLETLHDKKAKFAMLFDIAVKIRDDELKEGQVKMKEFLDNNHANNIHESEGYDENETIDGTG